MTSTKRYSAINSAHIDIVFINVLPAVTMIPMAKRQIQRTCLEWFGVGVGIVETKAFMEAAWTKTPNYQWQALKMKIGLLHVANVLAARHRPN